MTSAQEAISLLKAGNKRFVANKRQVDPHGVDHAVDENPIAIVLGCSDHRVPPDIIFDQGLGDLFVIRVAGNILTPTQLGTIEFGALTFGPRLIVVLGHSRCGAVQATIQTRHQNTTPGSPNLDSIIKRILPAIDSHITSVTDPTDLDFIRRVTHTNVFNSIRDLRAHSQIISDLMDNDNLLIVGAYYDMVSGRVEFIDQDSVLNEGCGCDTTSCCSTKNG